MPIPTESSGPRQMPTPPQDTPPGAVHPEESLELVAGLLAVILPGLGHFFLGERRRGLLIAAGVLGLFVGGILIGGIDVIDSKEDTVWFAGQALVGPLAFGVDYLHQNHFKVIAPDPKTGAPIRRSALPGEARGPGGQAVAAAPGVLPPNTKSLGRMNELGTLFATIAGMLNLIAIIDAALHARRERDPAILHAKRVLAGGDR